MLARVLRLSLPALLAWLLLWAAAPAHAAAAAAPHLAFVGVWDRAMPALSEAARAAGMPSIFMDTDRLPSVEQLRQQDLVLVLNIAAPDAAVLTERLRAARGATGKPRVVALDRRGAHASLQRAGILETDERIAAYWVPNGNVNMRRLYQYIAVHYFGGKGSVEPPLPMPESGYYLPGHDQAIDTLAEFRTRAGWRAGAPVAALLIQQAFWVTHDTQVTDALVAALTAQGFNVATIFSEYSTSMERLVRELHPDLVIEDRHGRLWSDAHAAILAELGVPYLRPISMLGATIAEWRANPEGLNAHDRGLFMSLQEMLGTIEPIVVGGLQLNAAGFRLHEPIPERVQHFAARARAWVDLRRTANADKRVAIVYYNNALGADDLMRGSPTGAFLDGPESLLRFLPRLKQRGYRVDPLPQTAHELIDWMKARGRNYGPWAQGDLERLADAPGTVLIPLPEYLAWYRSKLDAAQRAAVEARFGPPPGRYMVVKRHGVEQIVLPSVRLGNVILMPQPLRGQVEDEQVLHAKDIPPPHNYLAFHWWLQEDYKPQALVLWGTHGSLEMLPGKGTGLGAQDWTDLLIGHMPVIYPWIMDNIGESTLARRRAAALLVDHLPPLGERSPLSPELRHLQEDVQKFATLEAGVLKQEFRKRIGAAARAARIPGTPAGDAPLSDAAVEAVGEWLDRQAEEATPKTLHVLGQVPDDARLLDPLVASLRQTFIERLALAEPPPAGLAGAARADWLHERARRFVRDSVIGTAAPPPALRADADHARELLAHLRQADREIVALLDALEGRYIAAGPGPDPVRNPSSVPGGRNLYSLNPEEIPTRPSYEVARQLIDDLLKSRHPTKVGIDLNGMDTMRDYGVNEGQVLYLLGVRPVWDANGLAVDVELIPRAELKHPRVDVFIAMGGQYKDNFPSRVRLIDKAVKLAAAAPEADNGVRIGSQRLEAALRHRGLPAAQAAELSTARIFGTKPGNVSGTNILYLVPRSGAWESRREITSVYVDNMSYVYSGAHWGEAAPALYKSAIQGTDTLVRVWASNMTSQLSNHHAYEYLGGLSMAVSELTGKEPAAYIADVRNPDGARMRRFEEVLESNLRSELLNKEWLQGMKAHDYAGAGQMAALVENTFGWNVTRQQAVDPKVWDEIHRVLIQDSNGLGLRAWFEKQNPAALQEIAATMLEASRKGYWKPDARTLRELASLYAELTIAHGASTGLSAGGNRKLEQQVAQLVPGAAAAFMQAMARSRDGADAGQAVVGKRIEPQPAAAEPRPQAQVQARPTPTDRNVDVARWLVGLAMLSLGLLGIPLKAGSAR
ncbi:MAG: cobaltochelatase subunit CobN [Burkholderiales bacterium]|nr:cobaltochelatase subunit CobN [Burkholderiales bacterium]